MNQVDYRHYFKGRVWKNEGSQKVQEVGMYHEMIMMMMTTPWTTGTHYDSRDNPSVLLPFPSLTFPLIPDFLVF